MRGRDSVKLQEVTEIPGDSMGFNGIQWDLMGFSTMLYFSHIFSGMGQGCGFFERHLSSDQSSC